MSHAANSRIQSHAIFLLALQSRGNVLAGFGGLGDETGRALALHVAGFAGVPYGQDELEKLHRAVKHLNAAMNRKKKQNGLFPFDLRVYAALLLGTGCWYLSSQFQDTGILVAATMAFFT